MKRLLFLATLAWASLVGAQVSPSAPLSFQPLVYYAPVAVTAVSAATQVVAGGSTGAQVYVVCNSTADCVFTTDGTAATATHGMLLKAGGALTMTIPAGNVTYSMILTAAGGATNQVWLTKGVGP